MALPAVIGLAASAISGLVVAGGLAFAWNEWVDNPHVRELLTVELTAQFEVAAANALAAEQLRQFEIGERATNQFILEQREDAAWRAAREELHQQEIADYEQELAAAGRKCALTDRDIDFIDGLLTQPNGPTARRRGPREG